MEKFVFVCNRCGLCCCNLDKSQLYKSLDRGDGVCRYYDEGTKLCMIYDKRPILCNVDVFYDKYLKNEISRHEYYNMNYKVCEELKRNEE